MFFQPQACAAMALYWLKSGTVPPRTTMVLPRPRLRRSGRWWVCYSGRLCNVCGMGATPLSAYSDWLSNWQANPYDGWK